MATRRPARRRTTYRRRPVKRRTAPPSPAAKWLTAGFFTVILIAAIPALGVILAVGLVGGGVYSVRKHRAAKAVRAVQLQHVGAYMVMTPKAFEYALADLCRRDGCTHVTVVGGAGDLGADVLATTPDGRRIVIQAKRYAPTNKVGSPEVQKVGGTYAVVHRAQLAAVVTTSGYTKAAVDYAARAGIRLFDHRGLAGWASRTGPAPWH
jgi:restriction system protein